MSDHQFCHGDFGWNADLESGNVEWDGEGDEQPTDADGEAASEHWDADGYNDYMSDRADDIGDMKYEQYRENRWEE